MITQARQSKQDDFFAGMLRFRRYLASVDDQDLCEAFFHSSRWEEYAEYFRHQNDYYMRSIETMQSFKIITSVYGRVGSYEDIIDSQQIKARYAAKRWELKEIDWEKGKRVVCVGCGAMPETILYIAENTPATEILGIDYSNEAIYAARDVVESIGLDHITFDTYYGQTFDYSEYDVVFIAGFVSNKEAVLERIAETAPDHVQITVENPVRHLMRLLYDDILLRPIRRLKVTKTFTSNQEYALLDMLKLEKYPM